MSIYEWGEFEVILDFRKWPLFVSSSFLLPSSPLPARCVCRTKIQFCKHAQGQRRLVVWCWKPNFWFRPVIGGYSRQSRDLGLRPSGIWKYVDKFFRLLVGFVNFMKLYVGTWWLRLKRMTVSIGRCWREHSELDCGGLGIFSRRNPVLEGCWQRHRGDSQLQEKSSPLARCRCKCRHFQPRGRPCLCNPCQGLVASELLPGSGCHWFLDRVYW